MPLTRTEPSIPLSVPAIQGNEWQYVKECLDTNWVSSVGPFVDRFEQMVAARVRARFGVATVNGTSALHIALLVAGVQPGDEVIVPALTFIAPVNAVRYAGAWPVFMDAEPASWQMDTRKLVEFVDRECCTVGGELRNRKSGRRIKAIIPVHILGHPCDMEVILRLAAEHKLVVIEDATESLGAQYKGRPTGSLGDIGCFSFNGNKIITTGGGGMIVTDNEEWARRVKYLTTQAKDDPVEYVHETIGYNYRLTNVQAAIGVAQMEMLDQFVMRKREIAARYEQELSAVAGLTLPSEAQSAFATYWLYTILVDEDVFGIDSRGLQRALADRGIQARFFWAPINEQRPYRDCQAYRIETAPLLYRQGVSLPCSVGLSSGEQERVIAAIRELMFAI